MGACFSYGRDHDERYARSQEKVQGWHEAFARVCAGSWLISGIVFLAILFSMMR